MWNTLVHPLQDYRSSPSSFDPASVGDPLALRVSWGPVRRHGSSLWTRRLRHDGPERVSFRPHPLALASYVAFLAVGVLVMGLATTSSGAAAASLVSGFAAACGGFFIVAGVAFLWRRTEPVVFDLSRNIFWRGRREPLAIGDVPQKQRACDLRRVHALQIVSGRRPGDARPQDCYELNLVLDTGARMNVVDHCRYRALLEDGRALADLLGRPLWDSVER